MGGILGCRAAPPLPPLFPSQKCEDAARLERSPWSFSESSAAAAAQSHAQPGSVNELAVFCHFPLSPSARDCSTKDVFSPEKNCVGRVGRADGWGREKEEVIWNEMEGRKEENAENGAQKIRRGPIQGKKISIISPCFPFSIPHLV